LPQTPELHSLSKQLTEAFRRTACKRDNVTVSASSARRDYRFLVTAAFLWGCGSSQLTLLAVVLQAHGMTAPEIASVISCLTVALIISSIASGTLAARFGAVRTLLVGAVIAVTGIALLPFTIDSVALTALASFLRGFGFGLLLPTGQMFTQTRSAERDRSRAVAVFSAMFLVPAFFGPALGQYALARLGEGGFFLLVILPMALALLVVTLLPRNLETQRRPTRPDISLFCATGACGCPIWRRRKEGFLMRSRGHSCR
jgi:MFS family permease